MTCGAGGRNRYFYTGDQTGDLNQVGDYGFAAGGEEGSGISAGLTAPVFFPDKHRRDMWVYGNAQFNQEFLDSQFPFLEANWVIDIELTHDITFRVSKKNIYVEDEDGNPRFYQARVTKSPQPNITLGEWLSPNYEVGDVNFSLNNRDGFFNKYLPQGDEYVQWMGARVSIKIGFGEKYSNYFEIFEGFIPKKQGLTTTLEEIHLRAYDKFDNDDNKIPSTSFDRSTYPLVDPDAQGKMQPIVYGDWTTEVGEYGEIPAYCVNALDESANYYIFKISENSLQEIGDIYLHRGDRTPEKNGPILMDDSEVFKEAGEGRFIISKDVDSLVEPYEIFSGRAGNGGGVNTIISDNAEVDYIEKGIQEGDIVVKEGVETESIVTGVLNGEIALSGGITFPQGTSFRVYTTKYKFKKGDKFSLKCKGKDVRVHSVNRIADATILESNPSVMSVDLKKSYWFADDVVKKIYNVDFNKTLIEELNYTDIDPTIETIAGIDIQVDGTLWIMEGNQSKIYRYIPRDKKVGIEIETLFVDGILKKLEAPAGLTIDANNIITICDNTTGDFYQINPFGEVATLLNSFNRSTSNPSALDIVDISSDVNKNEIIVVDRETKTFFRINPLDGTLVLDSEHDLLTEVSDSFTLPVGVAYSEDGTVYLMNRQDRSVYNFNEHVGMNENAGFIARDIVQSYGGLTGYDFDLSWNQTSREGLNDFKTRAYIDEQTTTTKAAQDILKSFNTTLYLSFKKYALFFIHFDNFRTDGKTIREGDIKLGSFKPKKEYNQYFNSSVGKYLHLPFTGSSIDTDNYMSPTGVQLAGKEIPKKIDLKNLYLREDADKIMPLFVRLAAAEPEFIDISLGFRFLFAQPCSFYNLNFIDLTESSSSGRRFKNVPCFARKIQIDLDKLEVKLKLWSLGTTLFGDYVPVGTVGGGANDDIILTNLGTAGYVAPTGTVLSTVGKALTIEDVAGENAEQRTATITGKAWRTNFKIAIKDGATKETKQIVTIESVLNGVINIREDLELTVLPTEKNVAGFITGGHYIEYCTFNESTEDQYKYYAFFGKPVEGYPNSTTDEIEEQRSGSHNFDNGRLPYVLHPQDFVPDNN